MEISRASEVLSGECGLHLFSIACVSIPVCGVFPFVFIYLIGGGGVCEKSCCGFNVDSKMLPFCFVHFPNSFFFSCQTIFSLQKIRFESKAKSRPF